MIAYFLFTEFLNTYVKEKNQRKGGKKGKKTIKE